MPGFIPQFILAGTLACMATNAPIMHLAKTNEYLWGAVIISVCNGVFTHLCLSCWF